jgi:hydroxymethylpyrimidine pyrophosphatase-like HAD family hydrolase/energy-coupling factor transporter ATP-binding protein EcfA2
MRYHALATDYDLTIAENSRVDSTTIDALERARASGRCLILVTGRELEDLLRVFPRIDLFDRVVAENGALLYRPATKEQRLLGEPPPAEFVNTLRAAGVTPLSEGKVIVASVRPNETTILEAIRDHGLELQVIFNHTAVMVLPSGVNKASGLQAALLELGLSPHNCVGVGDAENDHAFLSVTECSVAVANALDALKKRVDYITSENIGRGVTELIDRLIESDLSFLGPTNRRRLVFGERKDGSDLAVGAYGNCVLIAGPSGSGKSTLANTFLEKLAELNYQYCIIDPEGDYLHVEGSVVLGDHQRPPTIPEVMDLLSKPSQNVTVNLLSVPMKERPAFFEGLLHHIQELHGRTGRPHWLVIDESHHMMPASWRPQTPPVADGGFGLLMITLEPDKLPLNTLQLPDLVIAVGDNPDRTLQVFSDAGAQKRPTPSYRSLSTGEGMAWFCKSEDTPFWFRAFPPKSERQRHRRKYAEGELAPERSFYFRGAEKKLNLRAQNLQVFLQLAEGIDDDTWLYHLKEGDISRWFVEEIKDPELAAEVKKFENEKAPAAESRDHVRSEIEKRYIVAA